MNTNITFSHNKNYLSYYALLSLIIVAASMLIGLVAHVTRRAKHEAIIATSCGYLGQISIEIQVFHERFKRFPFQKLNETRGPSSDWRIELHSSISTNHDLQYDTTSDSFSEIPQTIKLPRRFTVDGRAIGLIAILDQQYTEKDAINNRNFYLVSIPMHPSFMKYAQYSTMSNFEFIQNLTTDCATLSSIENQELVLGSIDCYPYAITIREFINAKGFECRKGFRE